MGYVQANSGRTQYSFTIAMRDCGTSHFESSGTLGFENTIIIQMEEVVQEAWDTARKISCDWKDSLEKEVIFQPFTVGMLEVQEVRFGGDNVECWMDIKKGKDPFGTTVEGILEIGEDMTVVVYASDGGSNFDILVKNCWAYDSMDYENSGTNKVRLSDDKGCRLKPKLMDYFFRTRETRSTGASIIAYAPIYAFKFPDKMGVYLTCDVQLCKGGCTDFCEDPGYPSEPIGGALLPDVVTTTQFSCFLGSTDPRCTTTTIRPLPTTTQFVCGPTTVDPRCPANCNIPNNPDPRCITTPHFFPAPTTTPFVCHPGSSDPRCPLQCFPGSTDPRCPPPQTLPPSTPPPTTQFVCTPNSLDPRCATFAPPTTTPFICQPGLADPRCPPACFPGSPDPRCPHEPTPPPVQPLLPQQPQILQPVPFPQPQPQPQPLPPPQLVPFPQPQPQPQPLPLQPQPLPLQEHYSNQDPRFHAFHRWQYEPAPSRFTTTQNGNGNIIVNGNGFAVNGNGNGQVNGNGFAVNGNGNGNGFGRRKREVHIAPSNNHTISFATGFQVISVEDIDGAEGNSMVFFGRVHPQDATEGQVCMPQVSFALGLVCISCVLLTAGLVCLGLYIRLRRYAKW
ncbi:unnamed protein product [Darwinula stevensoni]|uniref:ZP domain-containing protein n=1 Tax=Darwinula stevensoni TaxID=69355 RepID=A0A7R8XIP6_9CRUS|nr:unnamed protein product [Darwinula stevensoni]CAG0893634.1 unnamed protein product [Darwinula stevensoni]